MNMKERLFLKEKYSLLLARIEDLEATLRNTKRQLNENAVTLGLNRQKKRLKRYV